MKVEGAGGIWAVFGGFLFRRKSNGSKPADDEFSLERNDARERTPLTVGTDFSLHHFGEDTFIRIIRPQLEEVQSYCLRAPNLPSIVGEFGGDKYSGVVEEVGAGRVRGWVQRLGVGSEPVPVVLVVDGRPVRREVADTYRSELARYSQRGGYDGFEVTIPSEFYDGQPHSFEVHASGRPLEPGSKNWKYSYLSAIDRKSPNFIVGWVFDPFARHRPIALSLVTDSGSVRELSTAPRKDVFAVHGAPSAGFEMSLDGVDGDFWISESGHSHYPLFGPYSRRHVGELLERLHQTKAALWRYPPILALHDGQEELLRSLRNRARTESWYLADRALGSKSYRTLAQTRGACIIIPVYRGVEETIACIKSVLASTEDLEQGRMRVIVVNDASPEPELVTWLKQAAPGHFVMLENEENKGFVFSVNRAILSCNLKQEDLVLLNADTIVPKGWVKRLKSACYSAPNVASVTPFSNNGSICSYPIPAAKNELTPVSSLSELDALFQQVNSGVTIGLPTGVGFCMYLRGDAVEEIGGFDAMWGKGYGEETHWCMQAADAGWIHLQACDVFVYHSGSVSFGEGVHENEVKIHGAMLSDLYPEYDACVQRFLVGDPAANCRLRVAKHMLQIACLPVVLHVGHTQGGGLETHVNSLMKYEAESGLTSIFVGFDPDNADGYVFVKNERPGISARMRTDELLDFLIEIAPKGQLSRCHLHYFVGIEPRFIARLRSLSDHLLVTLHDFSAACPRRHLMDASSRYCGVPSLAECARCIALAPLGVDAQRHYERRGGMSGWTEATQRLFAMADGVIAPSQYAATTIKTRFPIVNILVLPHPEDGINMPKISAIPDRVGEVSVAVIGAIGPEKGIDLVRELARDAGIRHVPLSLTVIGYTTSDTDLAALPKIRVLGKYKRQELPSILASVMPDLVFVPSLVGETWCYTISEALQASIPVVCLDLGAQSERIRRMPYPGVIPVSSTPSEINDRLIEIGNGFRTGRYSSVAESGVTFDQYYESIRSFIDKNRAVVTGSSRMSKSTRPGRTARPFEYRSDVPADGVI